MGTIIGYLESFVPDQKDISKSSGIEYTFGVLTWITEEGYERKDKFVPFGDTQNDYEALKSITRTSKISIDFKKDGKYDKLIGGTLKWLKKGTGVIPVEKKEKPTSGFKKPFDNTEKEKRLSFIWAYHNALEYTEYYQERKKEPSTANQLLALRKRLLKEVYDFKSPDIGRSFIGLAIILYKKENLDDLNAVIKRAKELYEEYKEIAPSLNSNNTGSTPIKPIEPEEDDDETQNNNKNAVNNTTSENDEDLPF